MLVLNMTPPASWSRFDEQRTPQFRLPRQRNHSFTSREAHEIVLVLSFDQIVLDLHRKGHGTVIKPARACGQQSFERSCPHLVSSKARLTTFPKSYGSSVHKPLTVLLVTKRSKSDIQTHWQAGHIKIMLYQGLHVGLSHVRSLCLTKT